MTPILAIESSDILTIAVIAVLVVFAAVMVAFGTAERRRRAMVPIALRPGPSDEELERRILDRYLAVGAILTLFMAVFLPALLVNENNRIEKSAADFDDLSVRRGAALYGDVGLTAVNCARCHGKEGRGNNMPIFFPNGDEGLVAEPPLAWIYERYKAAGRNEAEIDQLIRDAIERGRPGTIMPTWSIVYGGPLNAQQVTDVINFIKSIQEEPPAPTTTDGQALFEANCAICHGVNGSGQTGGGTSVVGPNLQVALERLSLDQVRETLNEGRLNVNRYSMPSWAFLGEDAIEALVNFIQSIQRS